MSGQSRDRANAPAHLCCLSKYVAHSEYLFGIQVWFWGDEVRSRLFGLAQSQDSRERFRPHRDMATIRDKMGYLFRLADGRDTD